jgi:hypothetical protein
MLVIVDRMGRDRPRREVTDAKLPRNRTRRLPDLAVLTESRARNLGHNQHPSGPHDEGGPSLDLFERVVDGLGKAGLALD